MLQTENHQGNGMVTEKQQVRLCQAVVLVTLNTKSMADWMQAYIVHRLVWPTQGCCLPVLRRDSGPAVLKLLITPHNM